MRVKSMEVSIKQHYTNGEEALFKLCVRTADGMKIMASRIAHDSLVDEFDEVFDQLRDVTREAIREEYSIPKAEEVKS